MSKVYFIYADNGDFVFSTGSLKDAKDFCRNNEGYVFDEVFKEESNESKSGKR